MVDKINEFNKNFNILIKIIILFKLKIFATKLKNK